MVFITIVCLENKGEMVFLDKKLKKSIANVYLIPMCLLQGCLGAVGITNLSV